MAGDDNYMHHFAVAATSCIVNTEMPITLWALFNDVSDGNKRKFKKTVESLKKNTVLNIIDLDPEKLAGLQRDKYISTATYLRLFIPDLLPKDIDKVLYLDTDIIVYRDISDLWNIDISDYPIGAVTDPILKKYHREYDIPESTPLFNAGILVMNLKKWREKDLGKKALDYSVKTGHNDQIALNKLIGGNYFELDPRWNDAGHITERTTDPYITHYAGCRKPLGEKRFAELEKAEWRVK